MGVGSGGVLNRRCKNAASQVYKNAYRTGILVGCHEIDSAIADVRAGRIGTVPPPLRDGHYPGAAKLGNAQRYVYPPDVPGGVAEQQYPPDELVGRDYYSPVGRGAERAVAERLPLLRKAIRGQRTTKSGEERP